MTDFIVLVTVSVTVAGVSFVAGWISGNESAWKAVRKSLDEETREPST